MVDVQAHNALVDEYNAAVARLVQSTGNRIVVECPVTVALCLVGALQLVMRHSGFSNTEAAFPAVRAFTDQLIAQMEQREPALGRLLRLGDDPNHDVDPNHC